MFFVLQKRAEVSFLTFISYILNFFLVGEESTEEICTKSVHAKSYKMTCFDSFFEDFCKKKLEVNKN